MFSRTKQIEGLAQVRMWEVIIIGGGATGLGIAIDSATRGYKTLLLEQIDFAKGTSSRSTKLVHGGVRYLAQGHLDLVKEALHERGLLLRNAAHLVTNQSFIIPNYSWWETLKYTVGLKFYDLLSGKLSFGKSFRINLKKIRKALPYLKYNNLKGGVVYKDGQFDDARLAINMAQTAMENGARVINHCKVTGLIKDGNGTIIGVKAVDAESNVSHTIQGKTVINATGVFTDEVLKMDNKSNPDMVRPSQGIHLVIDRSFFPGENALMIPKTRDGRVLFLVPWHNKVVMGTTDTLLESHSLEPKPLEKEIDFVLETANSYLSNKISRKDVTAVYAGLRPLATPKDGSEKTKEISRSHKILVSKSGLITITGGKWTTYRKMAEDTINRAIAIKKLPRRSCQTKNLKLHGCIGKQDFTTHLYVYGSDRPQLLDMIKKYPYLGEKLHPDLPYTLAEVLWAVKNEMARTIEDVLARRVRLLFLDARAAIESAPVVAEIIAKENNFNKQWEKSQVEAFSAIAEQYILNPLDGVGNRKAYVKSTG